MRRPPDRRAFSADKQIWGDSRISLSRRLRPIFHARGERERSLDFANENESPLPSSQHSVRSPLRPSSAAIGEINAKAADTAAAAVWISNARRTVSASLPSVTVSDPRSGK